MPALSGFNGSTPALKAYAWLYLFTCALFIALAAPFYGHTMPLVFAAPMLAGLMYRKKESRTGFYTTLFILPAALTTGLAWVRYYLQVARPAFYETVAFSALQWRVTFTAAKWLIMLPSVLGPVLVLLSVFTIYLGYKYCEALA